MKEKAELDMKKEIKKLQRLRDFFKQGINSTEIKEKQKLQDARKKIETEMEKFREHEKEFKLNKLNKTAL
jgi:CCR4-NOT transcription complex subunit 3